MNMRNVVLFIVSIVFSVSVQFTNAERLAKQTKKLDNSSITYEYTSGRSYNVKFEEKGLSYRYLTGVKPEKWWGPFPYQAFEIESDVYMLSWFETGYGDYVTLLVNFNNKLLYGSAISRGEEVHFHGAKIIKSTYH